MKKNKKIYIIGNIPKSISKNVVKGFSEVQFKLSAMGFTVINPLDRIVDYQLTKDAKKANLTDLINAQAIYIMPNTDVKLGISNWEIRMAIYLDLVIISSLFKMDQHDKLAVDKLLSDANVHFII